MKKILAMAAVAALAAGASAYAANPFSDVSTSDWAYQAISDLSDRGMVEGYPDGTFKGQQNITRFEVAQIIARLMAKEDQMNAEDRAIIDRLASEYGAELQNLGVRVSNLEKKVGNIAWSGDARIRFQKASGDNTAIKSNQFNGRIRLNARATVNDSTYVHGRLVANGKFDDSDSNGGNVEMDRLYVHHQLGKVGATLGRYELDLGQQVGGWLYANKFDGIELAAPLGEKVNLALGYGRMKDISDTTKVNELSNDGVKGKRVYVNDAAKSEVFYAQLKADFKSFKIGFDYFKLSPYTMGYYEPDENWKVAEDAEAIYNEKQKKSVWGINLLVPVNQFRIYADYYADTQSNGGYSKLYGKNDQKGKIWTIGLGYGAKNLQKAGSFNLDLAYYNVKAGLYEPGMTGAQASTVDRLLMENGHFWLASGDVVVAKNTYVHGEYAFGAKKDGVYYSKEYADSWTLSLNYKF